MIDFYKTNRALEPFCNYYGLGVSVVTAGYEHNLIFCHLSRGCCITDFTSTP